MRWRSTSACAFWAVSPAPATRCLSSRSCTPLVGYDTMGSPSSPFLPPVSRVGPVPTPPLGGGGAYTQQQGRARTRGLHPVGPGGGAPIAYYRPTVPSSAAAPPSPHEPTSPTRRFASAGLTFLDLLRPSIPPPPLLVTSPGSRAGNNWPRKEKGRLPSGNYIHHHAPALPCAVRACSVFVRVARLTTEHPASSLTPVTPPEKPDEQAHSVEGQEKPVSRPRAAASSRSGFP
jgi:hypothetical protein